MNDTASHHTDEVSKPQESMTIAGQDGNKTASTDASEAENNDQRDPDRGSTAADDPMTKNRTWDIEDWYRIS